jgi:glycosyltransferase involved in cell wall biosynthesis
MADLASQQKDGSRQQKAKLLAISAPGEFSGLPDTVLRHLKAYAEIVSVIDGLRVPRRDRLGIAAQTFRPSRRDWGRRYYARLGGYYKRPSTLLYRIRYCERRVRRVSARYDLIYQFGALFGAIKRPTSAPLILHIDFTTRLAERYYPGWLPGSEAAISEWNGIESKIYNSADLIAAPTEIVAASLAGHYGVHPSKIVVVGMGAHLEGLAADFVKPYSRTFVFAGHDFERHGGETALRLFQAVHGRMPDVTMIAATNRQIQAAGVQSVGIVSRERLHQVLRGAAVLLMPGPVGGYQTVTEAMAAKCLCLVSDDNPHIAGLIRSGETGLTMAPSRLAQGVQSLLHCVERPEQLAKIGEQARQHVLRECCWLRVVAAIWHEIEKRFAQ